MNCTGCIFVCTWDYETHYMFSFKMITYDNIFALLCQYQNEKSPYLTIQACLFEFHCTNHQYIDMKKTHYLLISCCYKAF